MMAELLHDTNFWVLISFVIFTIVAYKYGRATVLAKLDGKIDSIRTELTEAERLRVDAQELLAEYQRKHKDAMSESAKIIAEAKKNAEEIKSKSENDLKALMERREAQLQDKLNRIEDNAMQEIQSYTAQIAVSAARNIIEKNMNTSADKAIISNIMNDVPKALN